MITSVKLYRNPAEFMELPMNQGGEVFLKSIDGLGSKSIVSLSDVPGIPGSSFRNIIGDFRAITLEIGYSSMINSIQSRRNNVLKYIRPNKSVTLRFESDNLEPVEITGVVETFENEPFSKEPSIKATLVCSDPYFKALADTSIPLTITANGTYQMTYPGTFPAGFKARGTLPVAGIFRMARSEDTSKYFEMAFEGDFQWSTVFGSRYLSYYPNSNPFGDFAGILETMERGSNWLQLNPGINSFVVTKMIAGSSLNTFSWRNRYVGV